jgi:hypothetical protein
MPFYGLMLAGTKAWSLRKVTLERYNALKDTKKDRKRIRQRLMAGIVA